MASLAELTDREPQPALSEFNNNVGSRVDDILNKLTGANGQQRYQLWPEKVIRGGLTAAGNTLTGNVPQWTVDKDTGEVHTSPQMIEKAQEISALAGTGGLAGADATLGSTAFLRPALKYKDKIYKGKEGQQHQDVIPKELYPEFEQMAMNGEDISHYNFGFMNHKGQFLDREKALEYAINEGLVDAHAGQYGALTSTLMADSSKPGTAIEAMKTALPSSKSLVLPDAPTKTELFKSVIENVPLSQTRATQSKMQWEKFNKGDHPEPMIKGYEDKPIAVKKEDGEYLIYDGHHRTVKAINNGDKNMEMYVVNAKDYAPELAGRKEVHIDTDQLLKDLK